MEFKDYFDEKIKMIVDHFDEKTDNIINSFKEENTRIRKDLYDLNVKYSDNNEDIIRLQEKTELNQKQKVQKKIDLKWGIILIVSLIVNIINIADKFI